VSFGAGFESVLDALRPLLPTCPLNWHYRSRDERLVAFSNDRIYGGALTTFPGVARDDCLRHVVVAQDAAPGQESSFAAEVTEVVRLVLEHARSRPTESLGVIALGMRHAERIDAAVRTALTRAGSASLESFFAEDVPEPFFVKNLERVQGDERDAIILSVGYGKHPDGRMRYQWGPLLRSGGERRLNVAATRAKRRLTVVSSFASHDVDPGKLRPVADDPRGRGGRRRVPGLRQRPRPGPAAQGAPGTARLAGPPAVVHQLVQRPRRRAGQAPRRLRRRRPRQSPGPAASPA
jgi:AAA domain